MQVQGVRKVGDRCGTVGVAERYEEGGGTINGSDGGVIAARDECGAFAEGAVRGGARVELDLWAARDDLLSLHVHLHLGPPSPSLGSISRVATAEGDHHPARGDPSTETPEAPA